jgi:hypothetical protein
VKPSCVVTTLMLALGARPERAKRSLEPERRAARWPMVLSSPRQ